MSDWDTFMVLLQPIWQRNSIRNLDTWREKARATTGGPSTKNRCLPAAPAAPERPINLPISNPSNGPRLVNQTTLDPHHSLSLISLFFLTLSYFFVSSSLSSSVSSFLLSISISSFLGCLPLSLVS